MELNEKEHPLVTVYILTYKKFDSIFDSLASVFSQDYPNIELILSDDGSPNFPQLKIEDFIDTHRGKNIKSVQIIANKENVGTVKHLNNILRLAKGVLCIPLAGDDEYYCSTAVSDIVNRYRRNPFHVLSVSRIAFNQDGSVYRLYPHKKSRDIIACEMDTAEKQFRYLTESKFRDFASGSAMIVERSFFDKMGPYDESYVLWEDGPFLTKVTGMGYKIDTEYEIISIKYRLGGVSSGCNPLMKKDMLHYDATNRRDNWEKYGYRHRRMIRYISKKHLAKDSLFKQIILYIGYFDIVLDRLVYKYSERSKQKYDSVD